MRSAPPPSTVKTAPAYLWEPVTGRRRLIRWEHYQQVRATPADVRCWFADSRPMGGEQQQLQEAWIAFLWLWD